MELLLLEEKRGNLSFENSQSEAQVALKAGRKRLFEERKEDCEVSILASRKV